MTRQRELLIMERRLDDVLPEPVVPAGVQIRTFVPGQDEQEWLRVNAAAFAQHPEQALIDGDDLADRMAEPWFDPRAFLSRRSTTPWSAFIGPSSTKISLARSTSSVSRRRQLAVAWAKRCC